LTLRDTQTRLSLLLPISVVENPTWRMPCFSENRSVSFSNRDRSAGLRPGTQR
jgi:hypothetical protein